MLIFTKSVKLLDMLDFHLNTKCKFHIDFLSRLKCSYVYQSAFPFLRLDGSIKQNERELYITSVYRNV